MEHENLKSRNQILKSDNSKLVEELKSLNSLIEELNKLKVENKRLLEECRSRKIKEKFQELIGTYVGSSKSIDILLAIEKLLSDITRLGFNSSSFPTPQPIGLVFPI